MKKFLYLLLFAMLTMVFHFLYIHMPIFLVPSKKQLQKIEFLTEQLAATRKELTECRSMKEASPKKGDETRITGNGVRSQPHESERVKDTNQKDKNDGTFFRRIPENRKIIRGQKFDSNSLEIFEKHVTVLIYNPLNRECVSNQLLQIRSVFPNIRILLSANDFGGTHNIEKIVSKSEGNALNLMLSLVRTKYFLYLSEGAVIEEYFTDNSVGWLLDALEQVSELDFIGAAMLRLKSDLKYTYLDIGCYRLRMCYWKLWQTYEYQYSVGDVMICEETSPSFMGRTASVALVGNFDETLDSMVTTDFFYRAKNKVAVGLRPEVFLNVPKQCSSLINRSHSKEETMHLSFMKKHQLERIVDSYGVEYSVPPSLEYVTRFHWVKDGGYLPARRFEDLKYLVGFVADHFLKQNITYRVEAGTALGGIKMRSVLPWDTGDIDTLYWADWQKVQAGLMEECKRQKLPCVSFTLPYEAKGNDVDELILKFHNRDASPNTLFHQRTPVPRPTDFLYITINGHYVPVIRDLFREFRRAYGVDYLAHKDRSGKSYLRCLKPGHHACVPRDFAHGGGHWADSHCQ